MATELCMLFIKALKKEKRGEAISVTIPLAPFKRLLKRYSTKDCKYGMRCKVPLCPVERRGCDCHLEGIGR